MTQAQTAAPAKKRGRPAKTAILPTDKKMRVDAPTVNAEKRADERFLGISTATLVAAIENATGFGKSALHLELAVGLALFANIGKADIDAKKSLYDIYAQAGYQCKTAKDADYKTVSRRINVVAHLYKWLGDKAAVDEWTVATTEMQTIQVIVGHIEEYDFKGMNDVLAQVGKPVAKAKEKMMPKVVAKDAHVRQKPTEPAAEPSDEDMDVMAEVGNDIESRRADDKKSQDVEENRRSTDGDTQGQVIKTAHMHVALPYNVDKQEVMELAMALLAYANGDNSVVTGNKTKAMAS